MQAAKSVPVQNMCSQKHPVLGPPACRPATAPHVLGWPSDCMSHLSAGVGQQAVVSAQVAHPQPGHVQGELRRQTLPALRRIHSTHVHFSFMWRAKLE